MTGIKTSIEPWLSVRNGNLAAEFYRSAFKATEMYRLENPEGELVVKLSIEGAEFWLSDESPEFKNFSPETLGGVSVKLLLITSNPEVTFQKAIEAGANEISPVQEGHGWLVGRLVDPYGHHWEIGCPSS